MIYVLDALLGWDETSIAYDMTRAHSADVLFLKIRAWMWGITATVGAFLLGNIIGVFDYNLFGMGWEAINHLW